MKQKFLTSGLVLGLALATGGMAARPLIQKTAADADKKEVACVVCGKKIDKALALKIVVKGKEQLVCSDACASALTQNPDKYLKEDGTKKP